MEYKHFSHQHNLNIHQVQDGQQPRCSGCETLCHDSVYACHQCNFFLHQHCGNATRYVKHPSHPPHPLTLVPRPTYCSGSFLCNACGLGGSAFSYCCAPCELDLHVHCAYLPPTVTHKSHQHELSLTLGVQDPKPNSPDEFCKICSKLIDLKCWSYCCDKCEFGVHTFCATTEVKMGLYQIDDPAEDAAAADAGEAGGSGHAEAGLTDEAIVELYNLQVQMQMAEKLAQMMGAFNLSSLV